MATSTTQQSPKDVVTPPKGHYKVRFVWVIDNQTRLPVRARQEIILN